MSTQTPHATSSSPAPSPFVPSARTKKPIHMTSSSSSSSRSITSSSSSFYPGRAYSDPAPKPIYAPSPTSYPSNDPSTQDFDFDDLFTFTNYTHPTLLPPHALSSGQPSSRPDPPRREAENGRKVASQPRPKLRIWSKFSFSHYSNNTGVSATRSGKSTGTAKPRR